MATTANDTAPARKGKAEIAKLITFDEEQIQLMKDTVARGATDNEFKLFMHLAQSYGLDPFAKEIWCIKYLRPGQRPEEVTATIFSSRDGYLKIASRDPQMNGIQSDAVCANDTFRKLADGSVDHVYGLPDRGPLVGAWALVHRKDRAFPAYFYAPFAEYSAGNNPTWRKYPSAMIIKVAEAMALKRAFSISGLVTQEELGLDAPLEHEPETSAVVVDETPKKSAPEASAPASAPLAASAGADESGELNEVLEQLAGELNSGHITSFERTKMLAGLSTLTLEQAKNSLANLSDTIEFRISPDGLTAARNKLREFANANASALGQETYNYLHQRSLALTVTAVDLHHDRQQAEQSLKAPQQQAA
jgi:phage recombination protein Bet